MEYKTDWDGPPKVTFAHLKHGELFRWMDRRSCAFMRAEGGFVNLSDGTMRGGHDALAQVVRIRIDRMEYGLPVFVDA